MATTPVYQAADTQTGTGSAGSVTVNKPTNLATGDLMIVQLEDDVVGGSWNTLAGWTALEAGQPPSQFPQTAVFYKIAGASEPASYTFTQTGGSGTTAATISRITGHDPNKPIDSHVSAVGAASTGIGIGTITPTTLNNLILILVAGGGSGNTFAYACDNVPSFTVGYRLQTASPASYGLGYGASTAAGSAAASATQGANASHFGAAISIKPPNTVAVSIFGSSLSFSGFSIKDLIVVITSIFGSRSQMIQPSSIGPTLKIWTPTSKGVATPYTPTSK